MIHTEVAVAAGFCSVEALTVIIDVVGAAAATEEGLGIVVCSNSVHGLMSVHTSV